MSENKTGKYFKYAIGEILLVVIGILIALQINNWNENRQNKQKINKLLGTIQKNIELDISEIKSLAFYYATKDSLSQLVLNDKVSREDYKAPNSFHLHSLIFNEKKIILKNNGYINLMRMQDVIPSEYEPLLERLYVLYNDQYNFVLDRDARFAERTANFEDLLFEKYDWFSLQTPAHLNAGRIDYLLNNIRYKGLVNTYINSGINNYLRSNINYALTAMHVYEQIDSLLKKENPINLNEFKIDSTIIGQYRDLFDQEFEMFSNGSETYFILTDSFRLFQYAPRKFMFNANFLRFGKKGDSIGIYDTRYENGEKPVAIKID